MFKNFIDPQNDLLVSLRLQPISGYRPAYEKSASLVKRDSSISIFPVLRYGKENNAL